MGSLCDQEVACSTSHRQGSNFESCVWRTVSSHSSHHPQDVLLAQFSLILCAQIWPKNPFISFHFYFPSLVLFYSRSIAVNNSHNISDKASLHQTDDTRLPSRRRDGCCWCVVDSPATMISSNHDFVASWPSFWYSYMLAI